MLVTSKTRAAKIILAFLSTNKSLQQQEEEDAQMLGHMAAGCAICTGQKGGHTVLVALRGTRKNFGWH